jgi:hypothetical protein
MYDLGKHQAALQEAIASLYFWPSGLISLDYSSCDFHSWHLVQKMTLLAVQITTQFSTIAMCGTMGNRRKAPC